MLLLTNDSGSVTEIPGLGLASGITGGRPSNGNSRDPLFCLLSLMLAPSSDAGPQPQATWYPDIQGKKDLCFSVVQVQILSLPGLPWVTDAAAVLKTWRTGGPGASLVSGV